MECPAAVSGEVVRLLFQQSDQNPFWAGELPPEGNHSSNIKVYVKNFECCYIPLFVELLFVLKIYN